MREMEGTNNPDDSLGRRASQAAMKVLADAFKSGVGGVDVDVSNDFAAPPPVAALADSGVLLHGTHFTTTPTTPIIPTSEVAAAAASAINDGHVTLEDGAGGASGEGSVVPHVLKSAVLILIILLAIFSNLLVVISVIRYHKLRHINNYFLVSLAVADLLVACFAMTFNATVEITGRWNFGYRICDLWISLDVHFSTVSTLHLCCISVDRYYAIVRPLKYTSYMTVKVASVMIGVAWAAPILISFLPIFLGWYTTAGHHEWRQAHPDECKFVVNKPYALLSSALTFWAPVVVMLIMYRRIYKEALRQKEAIRRSSVPSQQHLIVGSSEIRNQFATLQANGFKSTARNGIPNLFPNSSTPGAASSGRFLAPPSAAAQQQQHKKKNQPPQPSQPQPQTQRRNGDESLKPPDANAPLLPPGECETQFGSETVTRGEKMAAAAASAAAPVATTSLTPPNTNGRRKTSMANSTASEEPSSAFVGVQPSTGLSIDDFPAGAASVMGVWTLGLGLLGDNVITNSTADNSPTAGNIEGRCLAATAAAAEHSSPSSVDSAAGITIIVPDAVAPSKKRESNKLKKQVRLMAASEQRLRQRGFAAEAAAAAQGYDGDSTYPPTLYDSFNRRRLAAVSEDGGDGNDCADDDDGEGNSGSGIQRSPSTFGELGAQTAQWLRERHRIHTSWRKEHKAFVTLGIVMGAFLVCWLPFFSWYLTVNICGEDICKCPEIVVSIFFWIGYFNSTLNPVIYVMTNRDFKDAFTDILRRIFCWCADKDSFGGGSRGDWTNHSNVDFV